MTNKNLTTSKLLFFSLVMVTGNAVAENPLPGRVSEDADQFVTLTSENDKFFGNSDRNYTNGAQINYTRLYDKPSNWVSWLDDKLPFLDLDGPVATSYTFGQQFFTPDNAGRPYAQPGQQPFSGFLYGKVGITAYKPDYTDTYELTAGMVGPSAQGEFVQKTYHQAFDYYKPNGWDYYQLNDEPILNLSFTRRHSGALEWKSTILGQEWFADAAPHYGFAVGTAYDYANIGGIVRFGPASAQSMDFPALSVPGLPGGNVFTKTGNWFDWYVFAGVDGRAVARNIFLDGNTWQNSWSVDKKVLVGNATAGLTVVTGDIRTSLAVTQETKMYKTQPEDHVYGAINLGYRF